MRLGSEKVAPFSKSLTSIRLFWIISILMSTSVLSAFAADPSSGSLMTNSTQVNWTGSTLTSNVLFDPSDCSSLENCDIFTLNLNIPSNLATTNAGYTVTVRIDWNSAADDYDLYVYKDGAEVRSSGQGLTTFEEAVLPEPAPGTYQVYAHSFQTAPGTTYRGSATLNLAPEPLVLRNANYLKDPDGKFGSQAFTFTPDLRLIGAQNGQSGQNVEPEIAVDRFGTIYAAAIQGVPAGTDFWKSSDGGQSFTYLGQPDGAQDPNVARQRRIGVGGGDDDLSLGDPFVIIDTNGVTLGSTGRVYVPSLWLGSVTVSVSIDRGDNWVPSQEPIPVVDRQWGAAVGTQRYYLTFNQLGALLVGTTSLTIVQSDDGGLTYPRGAFITKALTAPDSRRQGPMVAGPDGSIYNIFTERQRNQLWLAKCPAPCNLPLLVQGVPDFGARPFELRNIFKGPAGFTTDNVFPVVEVDRSGNVHVAFGDKKNIYLMSSSDGGSTWKAPVRVNDGPETATALFPWIVAGDAGRVGIMWYGTDRVGDPDSETQFSGAQWKLFYSFTTNALVDVPTFTQVIASGGGSGRSDGVVHIGSICTRGLNCDLSTPPGNRNLAEYSTLAIDPNGMVHFAVGTDVNTPNGLARTHYIKQTGGRSLFAQAKVTGGGYVANGDRSNFGFVVKDDLSGSLTYLDHGQSFLLKADGYTSLIVNGNNAIFTGSGTKNDGKLSVAVSFTVEVIDNGEPGSSDFFSIRLSDGYVASGTLAGGNIQIHENPT